MVYALVCGTMWCMSVNTSIRLPLDLKERLQAAADEEGRSLNNYMIRILQEASNLREGHSTLGSSPAPDSMKGMSRAVPSKRASKRATAHQRLVQERDEAARQEIKNRVLGQREGGPS